MTQMDDHRICPHCGRDIKTEYTMSFRTDEGPSAVTIAWMFVGIAVVILLCVVVTM